MNKNKVNDLNQGKQTPYYQKAENNLIKYKK